uniref:RNase H type-1 domain-containing protein n=1 Tax=Oryza meridionalis TaxID=40149 RepID=A0A0E0ET90_9ORYZ
MANIPSKRRGGGDLRRRRLSAHHTAITSNSSRAAPEIERTRAESPVTAAPTPRRLRRPPPPPASATAKARVPPASSSRSPILSANVMLSSWQLIRNFSSAEEAEAIACRDGIRLAAEWVRMPMIVEADRANVGLALESMAENRSSIWRIMEKFDVMFLGSNFATKHGLSVKLRQLWCCFRSFA